MRTPAQWKAIEDRIAELETQKNKIPLLREAFNRQIKLHKQEITAELNKLKRKVAWRKFSEQHYATANHDNDIAVQMFGKRLRDLSPEEKKEYNRIRTQQSRAKRRKQSES